MKHTGPRVALLGLYHEANTFSPIRADMAMFEAGEVLQDRQIRQRYEGTPSTIGGMLAGGDALGVRLEPIFFARVTPTGAIEESTFERLVGEMLGSLSDRGPWDGVALVLHGAAVAEHVPDADGEIAQRVRRVVGRDTPIATVLDMHANVSDRLVRSVDLALGYRTNPHLDAGERGEECMQALSRLISGELTPQQAFLPLPLISSIARQDTGELPMAEVMARLQRWDHEPGMLAVSVFEGYPYADVPEMGMSVVAADAEDGATATRAAADLGEFIWQHRSELQGGGLGFEQALDKAERLASGPSVLLDIGDNIGGGGPGDSTVLWAAARERGLEGLLQTVVDPEAVRSCVAAGTGRRVSLSVGARHSHSPGEPLVVTGEVRVVSDGRFEEPGTVHGGFQHFDMGPTAVLDLPEGTLVISKRAVANVSVQQFAVHGIDPREYRVVIAKGVNAPRAAYAGLAKQVLAVDTPGVTSLSYDDFVYSHRRRPLYPFEATDRGPMTASDALQAPGAP